MAAGETTPGHRRPDGTPVHDLEPGEYALPLDGLAVQQIVWLCNPDGAMGHVTGERWAITVEDDDTITVDPSIWWDSQATPPGWHGYLVRGEWREV
jgi:hypothetical protein